MAWATPGAQPRHSFSRCGITAVRILRNAQKVRIEKDVMRGKTKFGRLFERTSSDGDLVLSRTGYSRFIDQTDNEAGSVFLREREHF